MTAIENERASLIALATMQGATFADVPGRYEQAGDRRLAQALDVLDPDEEGGEAESVGHARRYGRFILLTDSQGFVRVENFATIDEARKLVEALSHQAAAFDADVETIVMCGNGPEVPTTRRIRRDEARPGMIFTSSHGYRLLITEVQDGAEQRTDDRHVGIVGHLHAEANRPLRSERYSASSMIEVEVPDAILRDSTPERPTQNPAIEA